MNKKRQVSDILSTSEGPISFLQINHHKGTYMGVCPWCTKNLNEVKAKTFGDLYLRLLPIQINHMSDCKEKESTKMNVFI
jgi:hypothetical protein